MAPLNLPVGAAGISVQVHPGVFFNICDAYIRRNEGQGRVIGTLLGSIADGVVHVRNSYAVPHDESLDRVAVDINHHRTLYDLHSKVNLKEQIVGWYSTGQGHTGSDALIQDFYAKECTNPVHLTIDTTLATSQLKIAAYVGHTLTIADRTLATDFQEVDCKFLTAEMEKVGVDVLDPPKGGAAKLPGDLASLHATFNRLQGLLDSAHQYVEDVVAGRRKGDVTIGRHLTDTVAGVPKLGPEHFEAMLTDSAQDALLVMYLSNLVRTHIALADRLGTAHLPIL